MDRLNGTRSQAKLGGRGTIQFRMTRTITPAQVRTPRRAHRDAEAEDSEAQVGVEECEGAGDEQGDDEEVGRQRFS